MKKVIVFLIIVGGLIVSSNWVYYNYFAISKPYFKVEKEYRKSVKKHQTLVLGHSRAAFGIEDSLIEGSFNFASYGENNIYTYYKLKGLLSEPNQNIKRIIIPVGLSTFFSNKYPEMADHSYWNRYLDYDELGKAHNNQSEYWSIFIKSKITPYAHFVIAELNKKGKILKRKKESFHQLKSEEEKYAFAKESIEHNFKERNYYDSISLIYLKKLLKLCKENNIEVIPIRFPVSKYYKKVFSKKMEENNFDEQPFLDIFQAYQIPVWDEVNYFGDNKEVFKDVHHLNEKGRTEFTLYIKDKLN